MLSTLHFRDFGSILSVSMNEEFYSFIREYLGKTKLSMFTLCELVCQKTSYSATHVKNILKPSNSRMIPWCVVVELSTILRFSLLEIESFILSYGVPRCRSPVLHPKIPIEHTPIVDMLVAHTLADGSVVRSSGRRPYLSFRQHNEELMKSYKKKCEFVFGVIPSLYEGKQKTKTYLPAGPSQVLFLVSQKSESDFLSKEAKMPRYIFDLPLEHQFGFFLAFFADEGHVDSTNIVIRLKNKSLADGLLTICLNLGFAVTRTSYTDGMHQVYIKSESLSDFHTKYKKFQKKYAFVNLGYKESLLSEALYRKENSSLRIDRKNQLLSLLRDAPKTINELARLAILTRQGVRYHIKTLMKHKHIRHIGTIPGKPPEYVYALWE